MNGRVLIGDAIWTSKKIASLQPPTIRAEYSWLYSLAGPNGVFEIDLRAIWVRCYAFGRPEISVEDIGSILTAFEGAGLLFVWEGNGKRFGFWTNSDKPGRRPRPTWLKRYAKQGKLDPDPPQDALKTYLETMAARGEHAGSVQTARGEHGTGVPCTCTCTCIGIDLEKPSCADKTGLHDTVSVPSDPPNEELAVVNRVWAYYLEKLQKNPKLLTLTDLRRKKGLARLHEATVKTKGDLPRAEALMNCAVDNLAASEWHCGENPKHKRYDSWEKNLFSSTEQFERWLEQE
jgi:hypothetical protein